MGCVRWLLAVVAVSGCSFVTAGRHGSTGVTKTHEYVDAGVTAVVGVGCVLAAVAWAKPDAYAPVENDPSSWEFASDRLDVEQRGATWTIPACTTAVVFLASTIYGHNVRPNDDDDDAPTLGWAPAAAAFASGFSAAGQQQPTPAAMPQGCASDFNCGVGFRCVKRTYSSYGVCLQEVDQVGVPTYSTPNLDSVGPKMPSNSDCQLDTDCSVGFRCDARSGACFR